MNINSFSIVGQKRELLNNDTISAKQNATDKQRNDINKDAVSGSSSKETALFRDAKTYLKDKFPELTYNRTSSEKVPESFREESGSYMVYVSGSLQTKMDANPEYAKQIAQKIEDFFNNSKNTGGTLPNGTKYTVIKQQMAVTLNDNGDISDYHILTWPYSESQPDEVSGKVIANDKNGSKNEKENTNVPNQKFYDIYEAGSYTIKSSGMPLDGLVDTQNIEVTKANGDIVDLKTGRIIFTRA